MNELRANGIWISGCSKAVSSHIFKCIRCRKLKRSPEQQKMADLPVEEQKRLLPSLIVGWIVLGHFTLRKEGRS